MGGCISDNSFKNCVDINLWIYCGYVGSQIMQHPLITSNYSLYAPVQKINLDFHDFDQLQLLKNVLILFRTGRFQNYEGFPNDKFTVTFFNSNYVTKHLKKYGLFPK